jgi:DNA-binding SARP family transcriptional activator
MMIPNQAPPQRRILGVLWGAGSTTAYAIGIPALLVRAAGWPFPRRLPSLHAVSAAVTGAWRPDDHFVVAALAVIAWAVWAQIAVVTLGELRSIRSGREPYRVPGSAWCRPIALRLAAALAAILPFMPRAAGAAPLPVRTASVHASTQASCTNGTIPSEAGVLAAPSPTLVKEATTNRVHVVRPGETLWDIARTELGDPRRWRELFEMNRGTPQPDGRRLEDSELLRPGWRIELPGVLAGPSPQPARTSNAAAVPEATELARSDATAGSPVAGGPTAPAAAPTAPASPTAPAAGTPSPAALPPSSPPVERAATPEPAHHTTPTRTGSELTTIARIGFPSLTGGVLIGYLGGLRRERERRRRRHHRFPAPTPAQQNAERQLRAVARPEAPRWVDLALRHLAAALQEDGAPPPPTILAVHAGDAGLDVFISPPWPVAPGRFVARDDGHTWRLDPAVNLEELGRLAAGVPAYVPGVVTVGDTDHGAALVDLDAAGSLTVEGHPERADAIVTAMAAELATAPWSEHCDVCLIGAGTELRALERVRIVAAEDALTELGSAVRRSGDGGLADGAGGDIPAPLTIAVIASSGLPAEDLASLLAAARPHSGLAVIAAIPIGVSAGRFRMVTGADGKAVLYPLGLAVTPAQRNATATRLLELVTATAVPGTDLPVDGADDSQPAVETAEEPAPGPDPDARTDGADAVEATRTAAADMAADNAETVVQVRLLGPVEITWQNKPPKRQIGEFVSYLAVHPRQVTSEEARLALWPASADDEHFGERAPATYWALTTRARAALGEDQAGNPLIIREANDALRLSPAVGCDWLEFQRLVTRARRHPEGAVTDLAAALRLVRGRPFQGSVFPWVEVERLDGVMEAAIGDAATDLAQLALDTGDLDTARFAVTQGLLAVPQAEALVRWAMKIAAAAGDRAGIERAWRDAQRIATEFDPIGTPEPETAELYQSLRRGRSDQ